MLRIILVAAGTAVVTVAENASHVIHAPGHTKILVGAAFALPFLIALLWLSHRAGKAKAPAPAPAPRPGYGYSFRQPGRRG